MVATELLSLLEVTRKLASRKAELDKEYFENFVEPIWNAFNKVHESYKESFKDYLDLLAKDDHTIQALIQKISEDSIFTDDVRNELRSLLEHIPSIRFKTKAEYLANFIQAIITYLGAHSSATGRVSVGRDLAVGGLDAVDRSVVLGISQRIRVPLVAYLSRKRENTDRERAKQVFKTLALEIQSAHSKVSDSYYLLRKALLT